MTGKQRIVLTCAWLNERSNGPRSIRMEIDAESKLPMCIQQWEYADCQGPATLVIDKITYYETPPDELFEFEIPAGAAVIEQ